VKIFWNNIVEKQFTSRASAQAYMAHQSEEAIMKKIMLLSALVGLSLVNAHSSFAGDPMTPEACTAEFTKADVNKDGELAPQESNAYLLEVQGSGDKKDAVEIMKKEEFMAECEKGSFR
jgi:hypothetical protein